MHYLHTCPIIGFFSWAIKSIIVVIMIEKNVIKLITFQLVFALSKKRSLNNFYNNNVISLFLKCHCSCEILPKRITRNTTFSRKINIFHLFIFINSLYEIRYTQKILYNYIYVHIYRWEKEKKQYLNIAKVLCFVHLSKSFNFIRTPLVFWNWFPILGLFLPSYYSYTFPFRPLVYKSIYPHCWLHNIQSSKYYIFH